MESTTPHTINSVDFFWQNLLYCYTVIKYGHSIFNVRNSSFGKVMFSKACVKNSVYSVGGGGGVGSGVYPLGKPPLVRHPPRQTPPPSKHPPGQTPPSRHTPQADTTPRGRQSPLPADGHGLGQYASYWNASLYLKVFTPLMKKKLFWPPCRIDKVTIGELCLLDQI